MIVNGFTRFVSSGLSAALPHVVPREQVVTMNSVATATGGAAGIPRRHLHAACRAGCSAPTTPAPQQSSFIVAVPVAIALWLSWRFPPHLLGPDDSARAIHGSVVYAVATGWVHGARTVAAVPTVAATLAGLAAHRMVLGINSLLVLVIVRHTDTQDVAGLGTAALFFAAAGIGQFLAAALHAGRRRAGGAGTRPPTAHWPSPRSIQLAGAGLQLPMMVVCGFLLGAAGQVVKLCADSAMQLDVDDALRGHVFTVQDALFWIAFILAMTLAAAVIPPDGHQPALALAGAGVYLLGLAAHAALGRRSSPLGLR